MTKKTPFSAALTDELRLLCQLGKDAVFAMLAGRHGFTIFNDGTSARYAYRQGTLPVLGVAHADTVLNVDTFEFDGHSKVISPELDDRLGLWTLLYGLPSMGVNDYSVLVTDFEEIGQSTASEFESPIDFNWIFQFDRRGTGVVNYEYGDDGVFDALLTASFGKLHSGSFSDICSLTHLAVKGFNVGTAYYNEHTQGCWGNLRELRKQMQGFKRFFSGFKGWKLPHRPRRNYFDDTDSWSSYRSARKGRKAKTTKKTVAIPATDHPLGFHALSTKVKYDTECGSCYQTFNMQDCILLSNGYYLCEDCYDFCKVDLHSDDVVDSPFDLF